MTMIREKAERLLGALVGFPFVVWSNAGDKASSDVHAAMVELRKHLLEYRFMEAPAGAGVSAFRSGTVTELTDDPAPKNKLHALRLSVHYTQVDMASEMGMKLRTYQALEDGVNPLKGYHLKAAEMAVLMICRRKAFDDFAEKLDRPDEIADAGKNRAR